MVDSTLATPLLCRPLEHGAHVVLHSATKFLNGHHDVLAGAVCGTADDLARIRAFLIDTGGVADPDTAWLLRRGMRTLALRMQRQCANALAIATWLAERRRRRRGAVSGAPSRTRSTASPRGCSTAASAACWRSRWPVAGPAASAVMNGTRLIDRSTSLGGIVTGISHPASTSHRQLTEDELQAAGVPAGLLRLAVGCEDAADLIADLAHALESV